MSRVMRTAVAVDYPCSDGQPMAESDAQLTAMLYVLTVLRTRFGDRRDVFVGGDLLVYYEKGNPAAAVAPDVMVVFGTAKREDDPRESYKLWEEPKGPDFVLEVASRSTWWEDREEKRRLYASLGVGEYWLYDPTGKRIGSRLLGMRLVGGGYRELASKATGLDSARSAGSLGSRTLHSAVLSLDVTVEHDGALWICDPVTGQVLLGHAGEHAARKAAEARVTELEALVRELRGGRTSPGDND